MDIKEHTPAPLQHGYQPGIPLIRATLKHSLNRLPVTSTDHPEQICGEARRVGYTSKQEDALALYRLKIRAGPGFPTITLPGFYIIDNGVFQDYERWLQESSAEP
jgi:hypothetical protein